MYQEVSIGAVDGMALNRQQAIIWTNDSLVFWHIYESPGLNVKTVETFSQLLSNFQ